MLHGLLASCRHSTCAHREIDHRGRRVVSLHTQDLPLKILLFLPLADPEIASFVPVVVGPVQTGKNGAEYTP